MIWLHPSIERPSQHETIKNAAESLGTVVSISIYRQSVGFNFDDDDDVQPDELSSQLSDQLGGTWEIIDKPDVSI